MFQAVLSTGGRSVSASSSSSPASRPTTPTLHSWSSKTSSTEVTPPQTPVAFTALRDVTVVVSDIPWPEEEEALSSAASQCIQSLLTLDPHVRPSFKGEMLFNNKI